MLKKTHELLARAAELVPSAVVDVPTIPSSSHSGASAADAQTDASLNTSLATSVEQSGTEECKKLA